MYSEFLAPIATKKSNKPYYNIYKLSQAAEYLGLKIDKTRKCKEVFAISKQEKEVEEIKIRHKTYLALTDLGMKHCEKCIDEILDVTKDRELLLQADRFKTKMDMLFMMAGGKSKNSDEVIKIMQMFGLPPKVQKILIKIGKISR
jgi:hypothetical protein